MEHRTGLARVIHDQGRKAIWVAERLGVSHTTVTRWSRGEWPIPSARVAQLATLLGVTEDELTDAVAA